MDLIIKVVVDVKIIINNNNSKVFIACYLFVIQVEFYYFRIICIIIFRELYIFVLDIIIT